MSAGNPERLGKKLCLNKTILIDLNKAEVKLESQTTRQICRRFNLVARR